MRIEKDAKHSSSGGTKDIRFKTSNVQKNEALCPVKHQPWYDPWKSLLLEIYSLSFQRTVLIHCIIRFQNLTTEIFHLRKSRQVHIFEQLIIDLFKASWGSVHLIEALCIHLCYPICIETLKPKEFKSIPKI